MQGSPKRSKWKRSLILLKVYAGLCTLVVTGYLGLILWAIVTSAFEPSEAETTVKKDTVKKDTVKKDTVKEDYPLGDWHLNIDTELRLDELNRDRPLGSRSKFMLGPTLGTQPETNSLQPATGYSSVK